MNLLYYTYRLTIFKWQTEQYSLQSKFSKTFAIMSKIIILHNIKVVSNGTNDGTTRINVIVSKCSR